MSQKKRKEKRSSGQRRSSRPVALTELQKVLLGGASTAARIKAWTPKNLGATR